MTSKFTVNLQFDIEISSINVPDEAEFTNLGASKKKEPMDEKKLRQAMKDKGMSDEDIEKAIKGVGKAEAPAKDYQMLLYPEYEQWAAAQVGPRWTLAAEASVRWLASEECALSASSVAPPPEHGHHQLPQME